MSTTLDFKYRILYEALSRFSSALSRSNTLDEVKLCLQRQIKYLFDYQLTRFCFYERGYCVVYSLARGNCSLQYGDEELLWKHERQVKEKGVPAIIDDAGYIGFAQQRLPFQLPLPSAQVWSWGLEFNPESGILVSVFSGEDSRFQSSDIPILKIALENLYAKILSIRLIDELGESKKAVDQALFRLQEKNDVIAKLVDTQEEIIQRRTRELEVKNTKLLLLSKQHAHTIREPLSRILSMAYLIEVLPPQEVIDDIIPMMVTTSKDLDMALQQVIQSIDSEIRTQS